MLLRELLNEAPLQDFGLMGDPNTPGSFRADDLRAMSNPKWLKKLELSFADTEHNWNIYALNGKDGRHKWKTDKFIDGMELGLANFREYKGVWTSEKFRTRFGFLPPNYDQSISVLFTFNEGTGRLPFTQWMVAHRLIHALGEATGSTLAPYIKHLFDVLNDFTYEVQMWIDRLDAFQHLHSANTNTEIANAVASVVGKTRAMREGKLTGGGEIVTELGAQYLVKGRVTFRNPDFHNQLARFARTATDYKFKDEGATQEDAAAILRLYEQKFNQAFKQLFDASVGKIFVL